MTRTGPLLVAALATAAVLVPTGAAPFDLTGTDGVNEDIVLRPADGPNGDYALLNEDDELELLLTGKNPAIEGGGISANALSPIPRVFTMTYTGDQYARVWVTDDAEDVRFYRGADSDDSLEGRANSVVLGPSETVAVGLLVDTRGDHDVEQADTFSVNAEVAEEEEDDDGYTPPTPTPMGPTPTEAETGEGAVGTPEADDSTGTPAANESVGTSGANGGVDDAPGAPGSAPSTGTPGSTAGTESPESVDGLIELAGGGLAPLLAIGSGLLAVLAGLAGYRQFV